MGRRVLGNLLLGAGALFVAAGAVLLVADDGGGGEVAAAAEPTTSTTSSTTTTTTTTTTSTTVPPETPQAFFARFTDALNAGDAAFLVGRLHPAVFDRYERTDCEAYLGGRPRGAARSEVLSVGGTGPWQWETDAVSREIPDALTVRVRRTEDGGATFVENDVHVVASGPVLQWFTDCGTPKEGAR
jgi:hypothetical protein